MNQPCTVRKADVDDVEQIRELLVEWLGSPPPRGRRESIASAVANQEILVAVASSNVVGLIHYVMHNDIIDGAPNAFITAFYVRPSHRHAGVGASLLESMISHARGMGAVSIETSTTQSEARRFYERRGFKQTIGDIGESFLERELE